MIDYLQVSQFGKRNHVFEMSKPSVSTSMFNENTRYLNLNYHVSICSNFQTVAQNDLGKSEIHKEYSRAYRRMFSSPL